MNKINNGFTLAEVLIAVGIVAILAALLGTAFNHAKPDETKVLYLKAYDSLVTVVNKFVNTSSIYNNTFVSNGVSYNVENYPMLDFAVPSDPNYNDSSFSGELKFAKLLQDSLMGEFVSGSTNQVIFKTNPGNILWTVETPSNATTLLDNNPTTVNYSNKVEMKINDHTFALCVQADGTIYAIDQAGQNYIDNRKNFRSKNDRIITTIAATACNSNTYYVVGSGSDYTVTDINPTPNP